MSTLAVLPIKTLDEAKQRLSGHLTGGQRRLLMSAMAADTLEAIGRCTEITATVVVSDEPEITALAERHGIEVVPDNRSGSHSAAAKIGTDLALARGYRRALLLPGDCPLLNSQQIDSMIAKYVTAHAGSVVVVPDRHGSGTNALLLSPPNAIEPSFGPGSLSRHLDLARGAGLPAANESISSLALDLDTIEDLKALTEAVKRHPDRAPKTRNVLAELKVAAQTTDSLPPDRQATTVKATTS